ncbi:MAG TPA: hypothetical protein VFO77_11660, partial [Actinoplanes sp.]|nr:hypothetical protein [Actinoplanes sp.]
MTSNGQHPGDRRSDPTSDVDGAPGEESGEGFPPDLGDGQSPAQAAWGPPVYPNSYGPPPYPAQADGTSPFVVPAVPVFAPATPDAAADSVNRPGGPLHRPGGPLSEP